MIQSMRGRDGKHGAPPKNCDHRGTSVKRGGEIRCTRCWRVGRFYPQQIWHYAQRTIRLADMRRMPNGGTI